MVGPLRMVQCPLEHTTSSTPGSDVQSVPVTVPVMLLAKIGGQPPHDSMFLKVSMHWQIAASALASLHSACMGRTSKPVAVPHAVCPSGQNWWLLNQL